MRESPAALAKKQAGLTRASPAGIFSTFSNDFRRIGERQDRDYGFFSFLAGLSPSLVASASLRYLPCLVLPYHFEPSL
jgi:hypothetical protein